MSMYKRSVDQDNLSTKVLSASLCDDCKCLLVAVISNGIHNLTVTKLDSFLCTAPSCHGVAVHLFFKKQMCASASSRCVGGWWTEEDCRLVHKRSRRAVPQGCAETVCIHAHEYLILPSCCNLLPFTACAC
jgi:hypothetical protein